MSDHTECVPREQHQELREEHQELREEFKELRAEFREFRGGVESQLESLDDELTGIVGELEDYKDRNERDKAQIRQRITENDERLQEKSDNGRVDKLFDTVRKKVDSLTTGDAYEQYEGVPEPELSYMERLYHLGREGVDTDPRKRDLHAKVLLTGWPEWGWKDNNGNVILQTTNNLIGKLKRKIGDGFSHSQMYRACGALAARSDGKIEYVEDHHKIGRHLRIKAEDVDDLAVDFTGLSGPPGTRDGKMREYALR